MSRQLPVQPSLDHLRKQAKELLGDLERKNPGAKLADALHAVAREYGFLTWPQLKAHVESVRESASPFVGRWQADISRSTRHPANQFRAATMDFAVAGDSVSITNVVVTDAGREESETHTFVADGRERASNGTGGGAAGGGTATRHLLVARWLGARVLETVDKQDGRVVGRGTYEVSADGRTLTITAAEQVIVLVR